MFHPSRPLGDRRDKSHRHGSCAPLISEHQARPRGMELGREEDVMSSTAEKTVRELALENPAATRVFEKLGIDYCCGGNKSLEEACRVANLPMDEVQRQSIPETPHAQYSRGL